MDRDRVDAWVAGVDELLDGASRDPDVGPDAMRWAPDPTPARALRILTRAQFVVAAAAAQRRWNDRGFLGAAFAQAAPQTTDLIQRRITHVAAAAAVDEAERERLADAARRLGVTSGDMLRAASEQSPADRAARDLAFLSGLSFAEAADRIRDEMARWNATLPTRIVALQDAAQAAGLPGISADTWAALKAPSRWPRWRRFVTWLSRRSVR